MIVWKGWGILALIIPLICSWIASALFDSLHGVDFYKNSAWAMPLIIGLASIPTGLIGYRLNKKPPRILVDPETNEKIEIKTIHSMFWIPLQYWAIVILGICIWMYASNIGLIY